LIEHLAFWIGAALVVAALVIAVTVLESEQQAMEHVGGEPEPSGPADQPAPVYSEVV